MTVNRVRMMTLALATCALALTACKGGSDDVPPQKRMEAEPAATAPGESAVKEEAPTAGTDPAAQTADWCGGHGLPESKCTKCNPELTQGFKDAGDWCEEHGFPESACPSCNPQAAPAAATAQRVGSPDDWCLGHALPESMCTKCNPELTEKFKTAGDWCTAHELPESACPVCNPMTPPSHGGTP